MWPKRFYKGFAELEDLSSLYDFPLSDLFPLSPEQETQKMEFFKKWRQIKNEYGLCGETWEKFCEEQFLKWSTSYFVKKNEEIMDTFDPSCGE